MKRANEPRAGYWGLPSGFMEIDESPREAAAREAKEETGIDIDPNLMNLYVVGNVRTVNEVYLIFRAECESEQLQLGPEALEAHWFEENDAPWDQLAYPAITEGLRRSYRDAREARFGIYYVEHKSGAVNLTRYFETVTQSGKQHS